MDQEELEHIGASLIIDLSDLIVIKSIRPLFYPYCSNPSNVHKSDDHHRDPAP